MHKAMLLASSLILASGMGWAQSDPVAMARDASVQLEEAAIALSEAPNARDRVRALTSIVRAHEDGLAAFREGLRRAAIRETAIRTEFDAKQERLSRLIGVLLTLSQKPEPTLLLHPSGPTGTVRSSMILGDVGATVQREAAALRSQLEEIVAIREIQQQSSEILTRALEDIQTARTELATAIADRVALPLNFEADAVRMNRLLQSSETLDAFASGIVDLAPIETGAVQNFDTLKGALPLPVTGALLHGFNEADAAGIERPGLIIATGPGALVISPAPATVRYSGPLLDFGLVVILEPAEGYLLVLAGLGQLYAENGQVVPEGEPIGLMTGPNGETDGILNTSSGPTGGNRNESLYIELRKGETVIDPTDWFALNKE